MRSSSILVLALFGIPSILHFAGCASSSEGFVKDRGVYTTLAMPGRYLDLPGSGYTSCKTFGPGQTPAAVVVGYGYPVGSAEIPPSFNLEVVETSTGRVIMNENGIAQAGKAEIFDLPIRKSGHYRLKLNMNNSVYDTWDFTVNRDAASGETASAAKAPDYAQGIFSVRFSYSAANDPFTHYDEALNRAMLNAVTEESVSSSKDIFAQIPPGQVVVQFELSESGNLGSLKITTNSLSEALGEFFLRAIRKAAPYRAWPSDVRAGYGSGTRNMEVTFRYD